MDIPRSLARKHARRYAELARLFAQSSNDDRTREELIQCSEQIGEVGSDFEEFLQAIECIVMRTPNSEPLRERSVELLLKTARSLVEKERYVQALALMEAARRDFPEMPAFGDALQKLYGVLEREEEATETFLEYARQTPHDDGRVRRYLARARRTSGNDSRVRETIERMGYELSDGDLPDVEEAEATSLADEETAPGLPGGRSETSEMNGDGEEASAAPLPTIAGVLEATDDESEPGIRLMVNQSDGEPVETHGGGPEMAGPTPSEKSLPSGPLPSRLFEALAEVPQTEAAAWFRVRSSEGTELGRFRVHQGRILPAVTTGGEVYVDDEFVREHPGLYEFLEGRSAEDWITALIRGGEWKTERALAGLRDLTARGLRELLDRPDGRRLEMVPAPLNVADSASIPAFPGQLILEAIGGSLAPGEGQGALELYEAAGEHELEGWVFVGDEESEAPWLPCEATNCWKTSLEELYVFGDAVGGLVDDLAELRGEGESRGSVVSGFISDSFQAVVLHDGRRVCIVETPPKLFGALWATGRRIVDEGESGEN
jgi:hypothetical protein